ncbi:FHA domain-containing protein [Actinomyces trachealis]|uniref:FHA domain-containing protein n=1 Tax=Actinomyces trachealis TaxID=2763540 RepID=UPI001892BC8D|nr:FHA domain-containing protein [Actinomyces trachealis]
MSVARWWPGEVKVAVSGTGALAFDGAREILDPLWQQLDAGASLSDLLRQLVMAYDGSVLALPDFLLVVSHESGWRAVARGRFRLLDASGAVLLYAPNPVAWEEVQVPAGTDLVFDLAGPTIQETGWPLRAGVVPAGRLSLDAASKAESALECEVEFAAPETSAPTPATSANVLGSPVVSAPEPTPVPGTTPVFDAAEEPQPLGKEMASSATLGPEHLDLIGVDDAAPPETPAEEFSAYAHHYGDHTIAVNVAEAAIHHRDTEAGIVTAVPKPGQPAPPVSISVAAAAQSPVPGTPPVTVLSEAFQPAVEAALSADPVAGDEADWLHDGHTVAAAKLRRSRPGAHVAEPTPQAGTVDTQGTVLAVLCPAEHPNTVTALRCRVCGMPVSGSSVWVPRPVLGRLRTSSQEEVMLSSDVIIGRAPQATPRPGEAMPQLLAVACPDKAISKTHCAVRVDGWELLVEDLGSTNGTFLLRRGEAPRRVTRGTPEPLLLGDVLDLADSVTVTVEALDA